MLKAYNIPTTIMVIKNLQLKKKKEKKSDLYFEF